MDYNMTVLYRRNVNNAATAHIAAPIKATSLPSYGHPLRH